MKNNNQSATFNKFSLLQIDFDLLSKELYTDLKIISEQIKSKDCQTWRRLYVKSILSTIESQLSFLKSHIKITGEIDYLGLSEEEEAMIFGKKIDGKFRKLSFLENLKHTIELFSVVNYAFLKLKKDTGMWNSLVVLVKIRNRITHPSNSSDILISDKDVKICEQAFNYFQDNLIILFKACEEGLKKTKKYAEWSLEAIKKK